MAQAPSSGSPPDEGFRRRPIFPGCSISTTVGRRGTLGCFLSDGDGRTVLLTNFHVLGDFLNHEDVWVIQPAVDDGGQMTHKDRIARFSARDHAFGDGVDAAFAPVDDGVALLWEPPGGAWPSPLIGIRAWKKGDLLIKFGRTTLRTWGRVVQADHIDIAMGTGPPTRIDGFSIEPLPGAGPLSDSGDSGAVWVDENGQAVGLHVGGNSQRAIACDFGLVLDRLGLRLP